MKPRAMRTRLGLLLRLAALSLPLDFFLATYVWYDPFRVLYYSRYENFYRGNELPLNRDFCSTEIFLRQAGRYHYDSFILGNSRTMAFLTSDWTRWIDSQAVFHFDASSETLFGITGKLRLIDGKGMRLRNALILLDYRTFEGIADSYDGHLFVKHPQVSGNGWLPFQLTFLKAYLSPNCCAPFMTKKLFGCDIPGIRSPFGGEDRYDPVTNDFDLQKLEEKIETDPTAYYSNWETRFPSNESDSGVSPVVIHDAARRLLEEMREILARHGTDYRIVISPLWNKRSFIHPIGKCSTPCLARTEYLIFPE